MRDFWLICLHFGRFRDSETRDTHVTTALEWLHACWRRLWGAPMGNEQNERQARALHAKNDDGTAHLVGIRNLQVLITKHEDHWFAQGLEINYGVEGRDLDDVRRAFEFGLAATIAENLREFGHINHLLQPAPEGARKASETATVRSRYSQLSTHLFPFTIEFLEAA